MASLDRERADLAPHCRQMNLVVGIFTVQILCISVTMESSVLPLLWLILTLLVASVRSVCPHDGHRILLNALH